MSKCTYSIRTVEVYIHNSRIQDIITLRYRWKIYISFEYLYVYFICIKYENNDNNITFFLSFKESVNISKYTVRNFLIGL